MNIVKFLAVDHIFIGFCGDPAGSGKTAAFSLPILERLLYRPKRVAAIYALILTPTRELAVQVSANMWRRTCAGAPAMQSDLTLSPDLLCCAMVCCQSLLYTTRAEAALLAVKPAPAAPGFAHTMSHCGSFCQLFGRWPDGPFSSFFVDYIFCSINQ